MRDAFAFVDAFAWYFIPDPESDESLIIIYINYEFENFQSKTSATKFF